MCGLFGMVFDQPRGRLSEDKVKLVSDHLKKRGPNHQASISHEGVTFLHTRLAIIDLDKRSNQPFYSADGRYVIIYNGEVYNYQELRKDLKQAGYRFITESDTEVVLASYINFGTNCFRRFEGMFALAIFDFKTRECVLARDPAGIKPLYFSQQKDHLSFASDLRSLVLAGEQGSDLNHEAMLHYLHFGFANMPETFFKDVRSLLPGHYYSTKKRVMHSYHAIQVNEKITDWDEGEQMFEKTFADSVANALVSDVDVAVLLSGGIDSGLIVSEAVKKHPHITAYSLGFHDASYDETAKASVLAKQLKIPHHIIKFDENWAAILDHYVDDVSDPISDTSLLATYGLCREVSRKHKVVLSGDGADELFGGYELYRFESMTRAFGFLLPAVQWPLNLAVTALNSVSRKNSLLNRLKRIACMPAKNRTEQHLYLRQLWNAFPAETLVSPSLQKQLVERAAGYAMLLEENFYASELVPTSLDHSLYGDYRYHLPGDMLVKVDRASMAFGLEVRVPFLNPAMINMAFSLSDDFKMNGRGVGSSKYILRKQFEKRFGKKLARQKKSGFSVPLQKYFTTWMASKEWHDFGAAISAQEILVPDWKNKLHQAYHSGKFQMDNGLFALLILEKWLQRYGSLTTSV